MRICLIVLLLSACATTATDPPALYEEAPEPGETTEFAQIVKDMRTLQENKTPPHRTFHVKVHGCVAGTFSVLPDRPADLRDGLFKETRDYPLVMRFTNGSARPKADAKTDVRGVAMKVFGVRGKQLLESQSEAETQDFIMNNVAVPFTGDPREFADFIFAADRGFWSTLGFLSTHWTFAGRVMSLSSHEVNSLLNERYWSGIAIRLGPKAVKYNLRSCGQPSNNRDREAENFLSDDLAAYSAQQEQCWEFGVQVQKDPVLTPIEDMTVEWTEELAPTIPIARIRIPQQLVRDPEVMRACENLHFTPWHATEDHRPLGRIARIRRAMYFISQKTALGGEVPVEPSSFPAFVPPPKGER